MDEPAPTTSLDNDWCSVNEAARRLGVTATAIRNRIKRGTLDTRPNGNFGRLVRVPRTVTLTPKEPVPGTVPLTPQERVTLTVLADHVTTLKAALVKLEAEAKRERERADGLIPTSADQNPLAQSRRPMDMIVQGRSMSLFQATQQWSSRSLYDVKMRFES